MDKGPWRVVVYGSQANNQVRVMSDDFEHDVSLRIFGDFADHAERQRYAEWLAGKLNAPETEAGK